MIRTASLLVVVLFVGSVTFVRASGSGALQATGGVVGPSDRPLSSAQRGKVGRPVGADQDQIRAWRLKFEEADRKTERLPPSSFRELPENLIKNLQKRGCTIPQPPHLKKHENVIRGEFARPGQFDWAVLCSRNRNSSILVFWSGSTINPSEIAKAPDLNFLQGIGNNEIGFSRIINAIDRKGILQFYKAFGGPKPPPIDHQGINDAFEGKASVVNYCYRGKWLKLTGAD